MASVATVMSFPLTFHWYDGRIPPLTGVAVKVTKVPAQTWLTEGTIETLAGNSGLTVINTTLDMAGLPVAQVALEVSLHLIKSPSAGT